MYNREKGLQSEELSNIAIDGMQEKKAKDIVLLDLREVKNSVADFFVICSGTSDTQIDSIAKSVEDLVYKTDKQDPWRKEGKNNLEWVILDYVDVVVHIFLENKREFYQIESLWGDAKIKRINSEADDEKYAVKF